MEGFYNCDCMSIYGMCGMKDNSVDLTLTDIPYSEVNSAREGGGIRKIKKDKADESTFNLNEFLSEVYRVTRNAIIIFCARGQVSPIQDFFTEKDDLTVRQLIWEKTNPSPMNGDKIYLSGIENAIWARKRNAPFNAFCKNTVFRYPNGSSEFHPTEKNHDLLAELISDNSNVGDLVFDPCSGSASTLIVARNMGRRYLGFELDAEYYKKAKSRLDDEAAQMNIYDFLKEET